MLNVFYGYSCCLFDPELIHTRSANTKTLLVTEQQKNKKRKQRQPLLAQKICKKNILQ